MLRKGELFFKGNMLNFLKRKNRPMETKNNYQEAGFAISLPDAVLKGLGN